jgi:hypothetical protein
VDRQAWLRERRQMAEERHDTIDAFTYDDRYGEIGPTHRRFVADLLERCPPGGIVLDAACGTGKYFGMVLDADPLQPAGRPGRGGPRRLPLLPVARPGARLAGGAGLVVVAEDRSPGDGYGYLHLLTGRSG